MDSIEKPMIEFPTVPKSYKSCRKQKQSILKKILIYLYFVVSHSMGSTGQVREEPGSLRACPGKPHQDPPGQDDR